MENRGVEHWNSVGIDDTTWPPDLEEGSSLKQKLGCAKLELQTMHIQSANADKTICKLAALARRMMQERDEMRSQVMMLLTELEARNGQNMQREMTYSNVVKSDALAITSYHHTLVPSQAEPFFEMMHAQVGQTRTSSSWFATSNDFGYENFVSSPNSNPVESFLHGFTSSDADAFDPDLFLVDVAESQDFVSNASANSDFGKVSAAVDLFRLQTAQLQKCKLKQAVCDAGPLTESVMDDGPIKDHPSFADHHCNSAAVFGAAGYNQIS